MVVSFFSDCFYFYFTCYLVFYLEFNPLFLFDSCGLVFIILFDLNKITINHNDKTFHNNS